jgi:hypothetical protein
LFINSGRIRKKYLGTLKDSFTIEDALRAKKELVAAIGGQIFRDIPESKHTTERGWIYVIRDVRSNMLKIGFAKNPLVRMAALSTGNPGLLELIAQTPGSMIEEKRLHQRFRDAHHRLEWFRPTPEIRAWVKSLTIARDFPK